MYRQGSKIALRFDSSLFLRLAGGWLLLTNAGHTWGYYGAFVTRNLLGESRRPAYELMKEPIDGGIFDASFWTILQMLALQLTLFLAFAAILSFWIARVSDGRIQAIFARICTLVFGTGLVAFVFIHAQINAAIIAGGATTLYSLAWWRAWSMANRRSSLPHEST